MKFQSNKFVSVCREQENWSIQCHLDDIRWSTYHRWQHRTTSRDYYKTLSSLNVKNFVTVS